MIPPAIAPMPARRGPVLVPGLPVLPPNVERHPVPGGGTRTLTLDAGDELTVVDREGRQPCELVVFDAGGRPDPALVGATGAGAPFGIRAILDGPTPSAKRARDALAARGLDLGRAAAVRLFGDESRGRSNGLVRRHRPGHPRGRRPRRSDAGRCAVPPDRDRALRPPRVEDEPEAGGRAAAAARGPADRPRHPARYRQGLRGQGGPVHPGRGREGARVQRLPGVQPACSRPGPRARDRSHHHPLPDGLALSRPRPVFEVLHRRSRAAARASSRYVRVATIPSASRAPPGTTRTWDTPGHANCSDNINAEGGRFGIRPRGGWPAINFFYNTMLDDANAIGMDDPWSRPGDFVAHARPHRPRLLLHRLPVRLSIPRTGGTRPTSRCGCTTGTRTSSQPRGSE